MSNNHWNSLVKRIQAESHRRNGNTIDAVSQVSVNIVLHDGNPILWEITGSNKIEPSCTLTETVGMFSHHIQRLAELCQSTERANDLLGKLIDSLESN